MDTPIGLAAVKKLFRCLCGNLPLPFRCPYTSNELANVKLGLVSVGMGKVIGNNFAMESTTIDIKRFFNRSLGLPIDSQTILNSLFYKIMDSIVEVAIQKKIYNGGITGTKSA